MCVCIYTKFYYRSVHAKQFKWFCSRSMPSLDLNVGAPSGRNISIDSFGYLWPQLNPSRDFNNPMRARVGTQQITNEINENGAILIDL